MAKTIHRDDGTEVDATFEVESIDGEVTLAVESRGGAQGQPGARNIEYAEGLEILLGRLQRRGVRIGDAAVESRATKDLPRDDRRLEIDGMEYPITIQEPADLQRKIGAAQARVGRERDAKG